MVVNYRCIGKGVTNSNGVAQMTHSSSDNGVTFTQLANNGYEGVGKGKVDIVASMDKIINSGSVVSQPVEVLDCIFYDDGIVNPNTKWDCNQVTRSEETNGTKFLVTTTSASARASMNPLDNSSVYDFDAIPMAWEFDVVEWVGTGSCQAQFLQSSPSTLNKVFNIHTRSPNGKSFKIVYTGSKLELWIDGVHQDGDMIVTYDTNNKIRVGFAFATKDDYLIVKNVKAYPI